MTLSMIRRLLVTTIRTMPFSPVDSMTMWRPSMPSNVNGVTRIWASSARANICCAATSSFQERRVPVFGVAGAVRYLVDIDLGAIDFTTGSSRSNFSVAILGLPGISTSKPRPSGR